MRLLYTQFKHFVSRRLPSGIYFFFFFLSYRTDNGNVVNDLVTHDLKRRSLRSVLIVSIIFRY